MSNSVSSAPSPAGEFQAQFGGPPGSADVQTECKKWEKLCGQLLAEREGLRTELAKVQGERDQYLKTVYHFMCKDYQPPGFTKEEMLAFVDQAPPLEQFIEELEREMRSGA